MEGDFGNDCTQDGEEALHALVREGSKEMIEVLLDSCSYLVNSRNDIRETTLIIAFYLEFPEKINLFIVKDANASLIISNKEEFRSRTLNYAIYG